MVQRPAILRQNGAIWSTTISVPTGLREQTVGMFAAGRDLL
jgi:hypothetical protein